MDSPVKRRAPWSLTPAAFDVLLARLASDPVESAREFEEHRRYLITLFSYAGGADPGHLADITLDRAAKRLAEGEVVENLRAWLRGAARRVLQEERTAAARQSKALLEFPRAAGGGSTAAVEADHRQLEQCLERLGRQSRELIERYYQPRDASLLATRKRLAGELGISIENLRTRALRLRKALEDCFRQNRQTEEGG